MTNINCSHNCIHCENGKCTLNYITPVNNVINLSGDCIYIAEKENASETPLNSF